MIDPKLASLGYVGDVSDLFLDIFTGGLLSDQDQAKQQFYTRLEDWNKFLNGEIYRLPDHLGNLHVPPMDLYFFKEFSRYVDAWLNTGKPEPKPRFTVAADAINNYFSGLHYSRDVEFYTDGGNLPMIGRQKFILEHGLQCLARIKKDQRSPGTYALPLILLSKNLAKQKASAAHSPSRENWNMGI
jgi:hypothetical protein